MIGALLAVVRPVFAMVLIGAAATLMVAPAFDMASHERAAAQAAGHGTAPLANHPEATPQPSDAPDADPTDLPKADFDTLLRECVDSGDPDSDACASAVLDSGMSYEDFRAKIAAQLEPERMQKPEPKPEPTKKPELVVVRKTEPGKANNDFATWFEKCLDTRDWRSNGCVRAQELSGFNDTDFHSKFQRYLAERDAQMARSGKTPAATPLKPALEALFTVCGETHVRTSEACVFALTASSLQPAQFYAKVESRFGPFH